MNKKHLEVVAGIIVHNDMVFVTKRKGNDEFKDLFEFPGGKIEIGETKLEALKRELKEELSLEIEKAVPYKTIYHSYQSFDINLYLYICKPLTTKMILHVHSLGKWLTVEELKANVNLFIEADKEMIKKIEKGDLRI